MRAVPPELARHDEARLVRQNLGTGQRMHDHQWLRYYLDFRGKYGFDGSPEFTRFSGPCFYSAWMIRLRNRLFHPLHCCWVPPGASRARRVEPRSRRSGCPGGSDRRSGGRSSGTADRFRPATRPRHRRSSFFTASEGVSVMFAFIRPCFLIRVALS